MCAYGLCMYTIIWKHSRYHLCSGHICSLWHIYVSNSWNICVKNFKHYTHVHLWSIHIHKYMEKILSNCHVAVIFVLFVTFMSITPEIFVLETSNFTRASIIWTISQVFFMWLSYLFSLLSSAVPELITVTPLHVCLLATNLLDNSVRQILLILIYAYMMHNVLMSLHCYVITLWHHYIMA